MLATKALSLVEQKKLQWAKEREEMIGLYGLWGRPKNSHSQKEKNESTTFYTKNNLLPPIPAKSNDEPEKEYRPEEESETSGYLSDSPKIMKQREESPEEHKYLYNENEPLSNEESSEEVQKNYWTESNKVDSYWMGNKMYKNYKNENRMQQQQNVECPARECFNSRMFHNNKNYWYGTPESVSSDDGSRLRWGDRGIGIGHFWDPVDGQPDCRLPKVTDQYRPTPKWVEKGLKNHDGSQSEVLIINHPDDDQFDYKFKKNYILGQNAPISPEVIEERERKRKKALEHQNAIKKQLEEREFKRKQEKERRLEEERLEEERIKKEQEIERKRYEEEQRKIREKEEIERKREEAMREAIEMAEKRAREEKKKNKGTWHPIEEDHQQKSVNMNKEKFGKLEKIIQPTELGLTQRKQNKKHKKLEAPVPPDVKHNPADKVEESKKSMKDSSCQFEDIQLSSSFQLLNVNGLPVDGGLALMLDSTPTDSSFLLPPDGVQLALLMSPRNASATNRLLPLSPSLSESTNSFERTLTPSKYRVNHRERNIPSNKSTQTDFRHASGWTGHGSAGKRRRLSLRCGTKTGCVTSSQKSSNGDKLHKHSRSYMGNKYRLKTHASKLEDRPKWGINRPSVQYKKQSEKDPYYQKKLKEKLKSNAVDVATSSDQTIKNDGDEEEGDETPEEKELDSVVRLLEMRKDERKKSLKGKAEIILQNGFRMNSNLSSPVFVPIDNRLMSDENKNSEKIQVKAERSFNAKEEREDLSETEDDETVQTETERFLTPMQLEAIEKISNLRECLKNLQKDCSNSRSTTPFSERSVDK